MGTDRRTGHKGAGRRGKGFARAADLVASRVRSAGESRGFAVSRLLTHWAEVVGPQIAEAARPVGISYGRGFGATLTLLTTGARAPMLEMQKEQIRERVNACYGYAAISRVRITQTAAAGFAEDRAAFVPAPASTAKVAIPPQAREAAQDVASEELRSALECLGARILSHRNQ